MKKEYLLLVVVIIGLVALLFYQKKGRTNYQLPKLSPLEKSIDRLLIEKAGELVELSLIDGKWVVGKQQYRANSDRVKKIIAEVKGLKLTALVSEKGNYQIYDLVPEKKFKISLFGEDQLLREIQVGKNSTSLRQSYVMLKGDPKVYQALGNLKSNLFATVAEFRDKTVLEIDEEQLAGIETIVLTRLQDGNRQILKLFKSKPEPVADGDKSEAVPALVVGWQQESGNPVVTGEVDKLLASLTALQCESFIEDQKVEAFAEPFFKVVLQGRGEEFSLALLAPEEDRYPALSSQSGEPFWLPSWRVDKIIKDFSLYSVAEKKIEGK